MTDTRAPLPACLIADLTWGHAFSTHFHINQPTLSECYAVMNDLIRKMKFPRGKKARREMSIAIVHAAAGDLETAQHEQHADELRTYAHGLHYALCEGTPELFTAEPDLVQFQNEIPAAPEPAPAPAPKPRQPRRSRRYNGVTQAQAFTLGGI